jgi:hypothetical protein
LPDRKRRCIRLAPAALAAFLALFAAAPNAASAGNGEAKLDDGRAYYDRGSLRLEIGGAEVWSQAVKRAPTDAQPDVTAHALADGATAIDIVLRDKSGDAKLEIVALRDKGARALRVVWSGDVARSGDPGERAGAAVRFEDLTGDGAPEIVLGTEFEPVRICGRDEAPLLFRKAYDARARKFRDILARRPGLAPAEEIQGVIGPSDARPIVPMASAAGASRTMGDHKDTLLLAPPLALVDGDPATLWIPGLGASLGEFATLAVAAEEHGVVRIGVARPATGGKPAWRRVKSLLLVARDRTLRLGFPPAAGDGADMVWFDLKAPLRTPCLTLVVEAVEDGGARGELALSEVTVLSELDGPGGLEKLARELDDVAKGERAVALLRRVGDRGLEAIRTAWPKLGEPGRRRAVRVIGDVAPESGAGLLAEAAVGTDEIAAHEAVAALSRAPAAAAAALAPFLSSADDHRFSAAAAALGSVRAPAALDALCASAGKGGRARRHLLREEIAGLAGADEALGARLAELLTRAARGADPEPKMDLLRASSADGRVPQAALALALAAAAPGQRFEDRYRALGVVAMSRDGAALAALLEAATDADAKIRAAAVGGLAAVARTQAPAAAALAAATSDAEAEVRLAAISGLRGTFAVKGEAPKIARLAAEDPWPAVRAGAVGLAPELPPDAAVALLTRAAHDASPQVRVAALAAAPRVPGTEIDAIVVERLSDGAEGPFMRAAAALAARSRCQESAVEALSDLLRKGAEPLAAQRDIDAAVAAAGALGAIGGARAAELLQKARQRSNPATDAAIGAALEGLGAECGRGAPTPPDRPSGR